MHFATSLLSLLAAAASARAIPSEKRQDTPRIYAKFFSDNGCVGTWVEDTVWLQEPAGACIDVNIPFAYNSTLIEQNLATRTLRVYSADGCNENTGNFYDVPAAVEQCYAQGVQSVKFLL